MLPLLILFNTLIFHSIYEKITFNSRKLSLEIFPLLDSTLLYGHPVAYWVALYCGISTSISRQSSPFWGFPYVLSGCPAASDTSLEQKCRTAERWHTQLVLTRVYCSGSNRVPWNTTALTVPTQFIGWGTHTGDRCESVQQLWKMTI